MPQSAEKITTRPTKAKKQKVKTQEDNSNHDDNGGYYVEAENLFSREREGKGEDVVSIFIVCQQVVPSARVLHCVLLSLSLSFSPSLPARRLRRSGGGESQQTQRLRVCSVFPSGKLAVMSNTHRYTHAETDGEREEGERVRRRKQGRETAVHPPTSNDGESEKERETHSKQRRPKKKKRITSN